MKTSFLRMMPLLLLIAGTATAAPGLRIYCGDAKGKPCVDQGDPVYQALTSKNICVKKISEGLKSYSPASFPNIRNTCEKNEVAKLELDFYFPPEKEKLSAGQNPKFYILQMTCTKSSGSPSDRVRTVFSHANPMDSPYRKITGEERASFCESPHPLIEGMKEDEKRLADLKNPPLIQVATPNGAVTERQISTRHRVKPLDPARPITIAVPTSPSKQSGSDKD